VGVVGEFDLGGKVELGGGGGIQSGLLGVKISSAKTVLTWEKFYSRRSEIKREIESHCTR